MLRAIEYWVRKLESSLFGHSNYRIYRAPIQKIDHDVELAPLIKQSKSYLEQYFAITLKEPLVIELGLKPRKDWKHRFYEAKLTLGQYRQSKLKDKLVHQIVITPGLELPEFQAVLAHELTHAYQHEQKILTTNPGLREGMARWVEHSVLQQNRPEKAAKLLELKHYTFGKAVAQILEHEKLHGRKATMKWLLSID